MTGDTGRSSPASDDCQHGVFYGKEHRATEHRVYTYSVSEHDLTVAVPYITGSLSLKSRHLRHARAADCHACCVFGTRDLMLSVDQRDTRGQVIGWITGRSVLSRVSLRQYTACQCVPSFTLLDHIPFSQRHLCSYLTT